ncbi:MAG: hypothetical protein A2417_18005 [Bdellovibrionales bacterium RIFOXYC1_FULL_37_79]|nr:MAG: hypothetical protein A2181_07160 [Bdellovibrionales bacterium RIFOXYA1_FULL_38_20]OFZ51196.1 MAG: hypothetical protein A2417_18005 [Bdellovibrionales bacterium RIFOXYC1_FULL_37_79]
MSVLKITIVFILFTIISVSQASQFHIVTKSLDGLPTFKKGDDYRIKSMKSKTLQPGTILQIIETKHGVRGYKLVKNVKTQHLYFISTKWFQRGTELNTKTFDVQNNFEYPADVINKGTLQSPAPTCHEPPDDSSCLLTEEDYSAFKDLPDPLIPDNFDVQIDGLRPGINTYIKIRNQAKHYVDHGVTVDTCIYRLMPKVYKKLDPPALWGNLNLKEKASRVYAHAKISFEKIKQVSKEQRKNNFNQNLSNPHFIHEDLSPEIMACIAFIEVRDLNPHSTNYTHCQKYDPVTYSTAHGLGQMTITTMTSLRSKDLLPITSRGNRYKNYNDTDLFYALNDDIPLQMEVMGRYLNYEIKRKEKNLLSSWDKIAAGVAAYDTDQENCYSKLFEACYACMNSTSGKKSPFTCTEEIARVDKEAPECQK